MSGQSECSHPPSASALLCGMQAGLPRYVPTSPLQPFDPAWVTCMSSASQQPHGGVSPAEAKLPLPSQALQSQGRRGCSVGRASQPAVLQACPPTQAPLGFAAEARAGTGGGGPGPAGPARPHRCSLVELPLTSGRRLPCLHGDQTVSAAPG